MKNVGTARKSSGHPSAKDEQEFINRRRRKRSNSDGYLNIRPNFIQSLSTNTLDVLDCKSKDEYSSFQEEEETKLPNQRSRKSGFIGYVPQVCSDLARFVTTRMSLKRRSSTSFDLHVNKNLPLRFAIRNGDVDRVQYILETSDIDVNFNDHNGITAIHEAAINGYSEIIKLLLDHDAEINKQDNEGFTCLDYAVYGGHFECSTYLINCGATEDNVRNGIPYSY